MQVAIIEPAAEFGGAPVPGVTSRIRLGGKNVAGSPDTPRSYGGHDGGKGEERTSRLGSAVKGSRHVGLPF